MNTRGKLIAGLAVSAIAVTSVPALAESAASLQDLVDARAGQAESSVRSRGFVSTSSRHHNGGIQTYWWNERQDDCVRIQTNDGRYTDIRDVSDTDCGHHEGASVGTVAAVGVGAVLLGALISGSHDDHGSHHHSDGNHSEDLNREQQYELGFRAGKYSTAYHNADRSDDYSAGYSAGVQEREQQTRHTNDHQGASGYQQSVYVGDLQGARASALDQLSDRGFDQVDNFTSGNTRYGIWWNANTAQCLQATIADGRVADIRDIQTHPQCRSTGYSTGATNNDWYPRLVGGAWDGAKNQLEINGFSRVDIFQSGSNGRGTVWYNSSTRQCLQMIVVNDRVDSATDAQSNPRCR